MKHKLLNELVESGTIKGYKYYPASEAGVPNVESDHRNTENLVIEFNDGKNLLIGTFCSGVSEDTSLTFKVPVDPKLPGIWGTLDADEMKAEWDNKPE